MESLIVSTVKEAFPSVQAIYLFGTWGTAMMGDASDLDIALLLPPAVAKQMTLDQRLLVSTSLHRVVQRDVDMINLRQVDTVFQHEIINANRRIDCADHAAADTFEMLVLSYYQNLNIERAAMIEDALTMGCFYHR